MARAGFEVFCLRVAARRIPAWRAMSSDLSTRTMTCSNAEANREAHEIAAVFFTSPPLCDYKVKRVEDQTGRTVNHEDRQSSGAPPFTLNLQTKVIHTLRDLFPRSIVVWLEVRIG